MGIEWCKLRKSILYILIIMLIPLGINALLTFDLHFRYDYLLAHKVETGLSYWQLIFKEQNIFMFNELITIFCTLFVFVVFILETRHRGWINIRLSNYSISKVVVSKYFWCLSFMTILIIINCCSIIVVGIITGIDVPVEWTLFGKVFLAMWITSIGVIALNFLILSLVHKIVFIIPISCIIFMISTQLYKVDGLFLNKVNPYVFASRSYTQSTKLISEHALITILGGITCLVVSTILFSKRDELV